MPIEIHVTANTAAEAREHLRELLGDTEAPVTTTVQEPPREALDRNNGSSAHPDVASSAPPSDTEEKDSPDSDVRVDEHGVAFNPNYCGEAKDPFYGSGKRKGQWKKRKGVDDVEYDAWYDSVRPDAGQPTEPTPDQQESTVDPRAAFGSQTQAPAPASTGYPTDIGGFTAWTSERMAASQITQTHVDRAFKDCGLGYHDIMPGAPDAAAGIAKVCQQIESYGRGH